MKDCQALTHRSPEDRTPPAAISLKDPSDTALTPQDPLRPARRPGKTSQRLRGIPCSEDDHERIVEGEAADFQNWKRLNAMTRNAPIAPTGATRRGRSGVFPTGIPPDKKHAGDQMPIRPRLEERSHIRLEDPLRRNEG